MYTSMFRKAMLGDTALLALDFTTGTMPSSVTFTRADSTARATYIDASGYVKTVASAGAARFDYTGGVAKGLLIEAAATNYLKSSDELLLAQGYGEQDILSRTTGTSPSGGTAVGFYPTTASGYHRAQSPNITGLSGAITVSIWYKRLNSNLRAGINANSLLNVGAVFDLNGSGSVVTLGGSAANKAATITAYPNDWYRVTVTGTRVTDSTLYFFMAGSTQTNFDGGTPFVGVASEGMLMWGAQLEEGSTASSNIVTTTAALTRLADDAVIRSTAWTSLYAQPGAMVVEFYRGAYGTGDRSILSTDPTATRHWHLKQANASATAQIAFSTGSPVTQTGLTAGLNKVALAWNAPSPTASFDLCVNGATPTFGGSNVGTTLSTWLTLGSQSTTGVSGSGTWDGYINNSIKSVKYYTGLTYAEMQAKTT